MLANFALKVGLVLCFLRSAVSLNSPIGYGKGVTLVVGANGRLGRLVVQQLVEKGVDTRALVRDANRAHEVEELVGASIVEGDVTDMHSLMLATKGVDEIIDVHGVTPPRFVKITDLFRSPSKDDKTHPYVVNYLGTKHLIEAAKKNSVRKYVRLTGALVGASAFKPFVALFNFLLSFSNKWHERSEKLIRESGLDYTVVRPSEITNDPSAVQMTYPPVGQQAIPTYLMAVPGDADPKVSKIPVPSGISKSDVADLLVMSALGEREDDATRKEGYKGFLRRSTVICCSQKGGDAFSPRTFRDIMGRVRVSQGKGYQAFWDVRTTVEPGRHKTAVLLYVTGLAIAVQQLVRLFAMLGEKIIIMAMAAALKMKGRVA